MREINFRAWDKIDEKLREVMSIVFALKEVLLLNEYTKESYIRSFKECILQEYTGLKDKNGKEIYEGDITKSCEGYIRQVVCEDNSWKYYWKVKKSYQGESYFEAIYNPMVDTSSKRFGDEVIGNIYENKDLLE